MYTITLFGEKIVFWGNFTPQSQFFKSGHSLTGIKALSIYCNLAQVTLQKGVFQYYGILWSFYLFGSLICHLLKLQSSILCKVINLLNCIL
ncbi:hypothetical protein GDO81_013788 [Engystomops pustulosus]|uniref:Uncharacterized protein n=1 Tax=Engystomops pustulosus TaxID=76066 RepID=A0AAV7B5L6_ENGPU|nr:hypothetical protein GDO81_013788 [Engystomops pustulosus]